MYNQNEGNLERISYILEEDDEEQEAISGEFNTNFQNMLNNMFNNGFENTGIFLCSNFETISFYNCILINFTPFNI